jgi:hypothetical protein
MGRRTNSPPQFGQRIASFTVAQSEQNVHSKLHIQASRESGGRSRLQHSQFGFKISIRALHMRRGFRLY